MSRTPFPSLRPPFSSVTSFLVHVAEVPSSILAVVTFFGAGAEEDL